MTWYDWIIMIAGAGAFFQSIVGFVLILITNRIVRSHQPEMALF